MELDMSADDYDEEAMIAELAAYYGVDPSLISLEAEPITERRRLESAGLGRMRLKVTIVVPEEVEETVEGSLMTESSLTQAGSEGGGGGASGGPTVKKVAVTAESFAGRLAQLNSGEGGLLSLSAALGVNTTVAGDGVQIGTSMQQVQVACPKGYWCRCCHKKTAVVEELLAIGVWAVGKKEQNVTSQIFTINELSEEYGNITLSFCQTTTSLLQ